jgi:hypothetical protein
MPLREEDSLPGTTLLITPIFFTTGATLAQEEAFYGARGLLRFIATHSTILLALHLRLAKVVAGRSFGMTTLSLAPNSAAE